MGPEVSISKELPGDADIPGLQTKFWEAMIWKVSKRSWEVESVEE